MSNARITRIVHAEFLKNSEIIRGFIFALLPDAHLADDVLQEVFLVVTKKAGDFEPGTNFLAWVRAIARIEVRRYIRTHRAQQITLDDNIFDTVLAEADALEEGWADHHSALTHCLSKLSSGARNLIKLRYVENVKPRMIAQKLQRSVNAISVALTRYRKSLRECVDRRLAVGEPPA